MGRSLNASDQGAPCTHPPKPATTRCCYHACAHQGGAKSFRLSRNALSKILGCTSDVIWGPQFCAAGRHVDLVRVAVWRENVTRDCSVQFWQPRQSIGFPSGGNEPSVSRQRPVDRDAAPRHVAVRQPEPVKRSSADSSVHSGSFSTNSRSPRRSRNLTTSQSQPPAAL